MCLGLNSRAQHDANAEVKHGLQLGGVQVLIMPPYHKSGNLSLQQMQSAAPESRLLQRDYSNFDEQFGYYEDGLIKMTPISLLLNFDIQQKNEFIQKLRPELRVGLGYMGTQLTGSAMSREESFVTQDGSADSTYEEMMGFNNQVRMITGHVSLLVKSNPEKRFSIFGGVGFEGGVSLQSRNQIIFTENSKVYDA